MRLPWHDSNLGLKDDEHEGVLVARVDTKPQAIYRVPQSTLHAVQPTELAEYLQDKFKYKVLGPKPIRKHRKPMLTNWRHLVTSPPEW